MLIGTLTITLHLHGLGSLKDKRKIVKSVIGRIRSRYNFAIAEVDAQDSKAIAIIGMSTVSNDSVYINQLLDKVLDFVRADGRFYMGSTDREIFSSK
jgi:uncharacterized protein YlxP (DUF503 family)